MRIQFHNVFCWIMREILEMQLKEVSRERLIRRRSILIYKSNVLVSCARTCHVSVCRPCLFYNHCQLYQWHQSACKLWGTGRKGLLLHYVSALSYKRPGKSISLEHSGEQRRNEAEEADEGYGILEYDSSSSEGVDDESFSTYNDAADEDGGGIRSLDREATLFAWNGLTFRKNCSLQ